MANTTTNKIPKTMATIPDVLSGKDVGRLVGGEGGLVGGVVRVVVGGVVASVEGLVGGVVRVVVGVVVSVEGLVGDAVGVVGIIGIVVGELTRPETVTIYPNENSNKSK